MAEGEKRDGASVRLPPPVVFVGLLVAGVLLDLWVLPWPSPGWLQAATARVLSSGVAALVAMGLLAGAMQLFSRSGQSPEPWLPTPEVIRSGPFAYTRNPMYLGMALLQLSLGLALSNLWVVALVPVSLWIVYLTAVRHEEAYLSAKFGTTYAEYKRRVRRWL